MKNIVLYILLISLFFSNFAFGQDKKEYKIACVAFYNLENLFDTIPADDYEDFTPESPKRWDSDKYDRKLKRLSSVLSKLGYDLTKTAPIVMGVCEAENEKVLQDLVKTEELAKYDYKIIHFESPSYRGIDVAFLYRDAFFQPTNIVVYPLKIDGNPSFKTRDALLVSGMFDGEEMHFIVLHWPSRLGGEKRSLPKRLAAAKLVRGIIDSVHNENANAKIFAMGDLNDDPTSPSITQVLNAVGDKKKAVWPKLFNPMYSFFKKGIGSNAYQDAWSLFDQIILSPALVEKDYSTYRFYKAFIYNNPKMMQKEGRFKGYPFRSYSGDTYIDGYSDHLPSGVYIIKEK